MATALEESYSRVTGTPINASGGGRPGGDQIAISFSKGKKSTKEQLDELAILKAQDDLNRLSLIPVGSEQQRYEWEAENQRLAQEAAVRSATQAAIDIKQREQALKTSLVMDPLDALAQTTSIQGQLANTQAQELAIREKRLLLPGELAAQQASLASSQQALSASQQAAAHAAKMNPLDVKSAEMQLAQSKITNPLDVKAKQVGIQGAQQQIQTAALDEYYRTQAYKDTHAGLTPTQVNQAHANQAKMNVVYQNTPVTPAAQQAYNSLMGYKPLGQVTTDGYVFPTSGSAPIYVGSMAQRTKENSTAAAKSSALYYKNQGQGVYKNTYL